MITNCQTHHSHFDKLLEAEQISLKETAALARAPIVEMISVTFSGGPMRSIASTNNPKL